MNIQKRTRPLSFMGLSTLMLVSCITVMVGTAIISAVPEIAREFGLSAHLSGWLVTTPALGVIIGSVPAGKMIGKIGAYKVCMIGLTFYGIFGIIGCVMPELITLFASRLMLGIGTAAVMTSSTALISEYYTGRKRLKVIAMQGMALELGGIIFLSLGGFLAEIDWHAPFFIYVIGFIALAWLYMFVPSPNKIKTQNMVINIDEDINTKKAGKIASVIILAFITGLIFFSGIVTLPVHLQQTLGYSPSFNGNFLAFVSIMAVIAAGTMPKIVEKLSSKFCLCTAFICYTASYILFFQFQHIAYLILAAIFLGVGFGLSIPLINNLTVERSDKVSIGRHLAYYSIAASLGQFLSSFIGSLNMGVYSFLIIAIIAFVTWLGTFLLFK